MRSGAEIRIAAFAACVVGASRIPADLALTYNEVFNNLAEIMLGRALAEIYGREKYRASSQPEGKLLDWEMPLAAMQFALPRELAVALWCTFPPYLKKPI